MKNYAMRIGVLLAIETSWSVLDPALAGIVALNILWSGWKVMTSSLSGLMDEAVPNDTLAKIKSGDASWEEMVPAEVSAIIKERRLLGYQPQA